MKNITQRIKSEKLKTKIIPNIRDVLDSIEYDKKDEYKLKNYIKIYLENEYPIEILKQQWPLIATKLKSRDSSSLESFIIKYGEDLGKQLFSEKVDKTKSTKDDFIEKYGEDLAKKKLSARGASLENYINRHGETLGQEKWKKYCERRKQCFQQGKQEGRYASRNLKWFQDRYGNKKGYAVWDAKRKSRSEKISRVYLEKIHGKEKTNLILKERHSRDLNFYINKYGEIEGAQQYRSAMYRQHKNRKNKTYSKWANWLCEQILEQICDLKYYSNNELILGLTAEQEEKYGQKIIIPDLFYKGKIIEFNGDLFHGNPELFNDEDCPHPFRKELTAKEMREKDKKRYQYYHDKGYQLLVVWENDYKKNSTGILEQCLEFLK